MIVQWLIRATQGYLSYWQNKYDQLVLYDQKLHGATSRRWLFVACIVIVILVVLIIWTLLLQGHHVKLYLDWGNTVPFPDDVSAGFSFDCKAFQQQVQYLPGTSIPLYQPLPQPNDQRQQQYQQQQQAIRFHCDIKDYPVKRFRNLSNLHEWGNTFSQHLKSTTIRLDCESYGAPICCAMTDAVINNKTVYSRSDTTSSTDIMRSHLLAKSSSNTLHDANAAAAASDNEMFEPRNRLMRNRKRQQESINNMKIGGKKKRRNLQLESVSTAAATSGLQCSEQRKYIASPYELRHRKAAEELNQIEDEHSRRNALIEFMLSDIPQANIWLERVRLRMQSVDKDATATTAAATVEDYEYLSRFEVTRSCRRQPQQRQQQREEASSGWRNGIWSVLGGGSEQIDSLNVNPPLKKKSIPSSNINVDDSNSHSITSWLEWIEPLSIHARHPFSYTDCIPDHLNISQPYWVDIFRSYKHLMKFPDVGLISADHVLLKSAVAAATSAAAANNKNLAVNQLRKQQLQQQQSAKRAAVSRNILFDVGTSTFDSSLFWFLCGYLQRGIEFDKIFGWEMTQLEPGDFWRRVPAQVLPKYHFYNVPVSADINDRNSVLRVIQQVATADDFVALKLDIDTPQVEIPIVLQLLASNTATTVEDITADATLSPETATASASPAATAPSSPSFISADEGYQIKSLVDEFFFELHFRCEMLMYCGWTRAVPHQHGSLVLDRPHALQLFQRLREGGIRAHIWP